jgi:hypothetical protein
MKILSLFRGQPKPPVRKCRCAHCGNEKEAPSWWDGSQPVVCLICHTLLKKEEERERAKRDQVELIKIAIREMKADGEI